ncbi:glycoside hydrolase TIM-barrel-like domain-containing protein [Rhodoblastus acidophilus]|uniref:Glycoside hydrolase TIM-barrel-like domain-containing protein n=1 Tax=Candidatus Rhodoblastus alkanivorans TaxID=2954117 RepID=A0ABS9Z8W4_9HYPH|nr:glycoside hydrolase TIM-barrel-like domain-containing protein [Candidatus Rhodoblastus alkanivorans]MCI4680172.1 glycoside hydrolase TIM-barrel-like domain-containing protein [Candidatus Rhodoblastus alkanivorans]MCI4684129.1 glycoside hydrolase TIM-barrel-like domain-containing protein [Candidatus Rhodoblastus alkanivorans]MDI4641449.1 glycoside hydrolase TIM-barrel-like domain-containing protein [Rhodoblastus acidophilus]
MAQVFGVCLLPATGEFSYDTIPAQGARWDPAGGVAGGGALESLSPINCFYAPGGTRTDYSVALDQLQAEHPECQTVALVVAWFGDSTDAASCRIYPSTSYIVGAFESWGGSAWSAVNWQCSGLTQASSGLIPISQTNGGFTYGGTPSDQSVVRCIRDLKARGFRVIFYPFILMDCAGKPWRGRIGLSSDLSSAATSAVSDFLGSAAPSQFSRDTVNLTVAYSGSSADYTFRRFILHYANLCVVAGGVDLFLIGSELRGLEVIRGPAWTKTGSVDANGDAVWDYPFVAGLAQLAADVRLVFDGAGLTKNLTSWKNLIAYSPDWSSWNGWQHAGENGQWPHLDSLFASPNIDLVSFDNYLPLSDWTTGSGGLDCANWTAPKATTWPASTAAMNGLGLFGSPTIYSEHYLAGNIEGGEQFDWYYGDSNNDGRGLDPNGSGVMVSLPEGDRLTQGRNPYYAGQQLLARKQFRWWWRNTHQAIYDAGDGNGWAPHGPATQWTAQMKPMIFAEYGFATVDRCTNQPNVFFDPNSTESDTPFWSVWNSSDGDTWTPRRDDNLANLGLQTIYDYWSEASNNPSSNGGPMILTPFCCAWNWDARPFPTFPLNASAWGDAANWAAGNWIGGKGPYVAIPAPDAPPGPGAYATFPTLSGEAWSAHYKPRFSTRTAAKASGRETPAAVFASPLWDIELRFDVLRSATAFSEMQEVLAFADEVAGQGAPFLFAPPGSLGVYFGASLGSGDGATRAFVLSRAIGGYVERVQALIGSPTVYVDGVALGPSAYSVSVLPATITFATAPAAGAALTIDFSVAHLARFSDDTEDLEQIMSGLWQAGAIRLETVRA